MSTLRVETNIGANVEFALGMKGTVKRVAEDGLASVTGLNEDDSPKVTVYMDGYAPKEEKVASMAKNVTLTIELEKIKAVGEAVQQKAMETAIPVVTEVVNKISSIDITNIDEAKKDYKELEKFIKNQKSTVEEALKSGAYDVAQSAGAELVNTVRTKLNESMEYYVNLRSKLNPLGSWVEFRNYVEYTSMISSIYFIRQNLVSWFNDIMKKLEKM